MGIGANQRENVENGGGWKHFLWKICLFGKSEVSLQRFHTRNRLL